MAQPPAYLRQADFTSFQTSNPGQPMSGASLDSEFNALKAVTAAVRANMAVIQRDDLALKNGSVHPDSLSTATLAMIGSNLTPRGQWAALTLYEVCDIVENAGTSYVCHTQHTSGASFATTNWTVLGTTAQIAQTAFFASAGGTADAITATFTPDLPALTDGLEVRVRAAAANTSTTVTFNGKSVKRFGNQALEVGDIPRSGYEMTLRFNLSNDVWELLNPEPIDYSIPSGSSRIGHIGPEDGEVASTVETRLNEWVSAFRFMTAAQIADVKARTKTLDVTTALAAAHATGKQVRYPTGTYRVDGSIGSEASPVWNFTMVGEGEEHTIIDLTNNTTFFAAVEYRHTVKDVMFTRDHVANSGDVFRRKNSTDQGFCKFERASARSIGGAFLKLFGAGNGSKISFEKFTYVSLYNAGTGYGGRLFDSATNSVETDSITINDCWIESINDVTIDAYNLGRLSITGATRFIPYTNPTQGFWIKTTGYSPHVYIGGGADFGGESVRRVFDWRGTGGDIQIDGAGIFCAARGAFTFTNAVPDFINLNGITGLVDTFGLIKVVSVSNADKLAWSKCVISIGANQAPVALYFADFNGDTVVLSQAANSDNPQKEAVVSTSDLITISGSSWVASGSLSSVTEATGASAPDVLGDNSWGFKHTASANGGNFSKTLNAAFGTIPDGPATLEALVTVTGGPMVYSLLIGSVRKTFILAPGNHFLCLPCIVTPSLARTLGIEGTFMRSGDTCSTNRIRVWKGQFNRRQREILATAAPGAGTIWFKNDRLITAAPTAGQPKGWFVTVAGDPATFVSEGNL